MMLPLHGAEPRINTCRNQGKNSISILPAAPAGTNGRDPSIIRMGDVMGYQVWSSIGGIT